jgi:hypothetical protein
MTPWRHIAMVYSSTFAANLNDERLSGVVPYIVMKAWHHLVTEAVFLCASPVACRNCMLGWVKLEPKFSSI